jgi:hypothetical protein
MKANHKNLAAKATLVYNLYLDPGAQPIVELKQESNSVRGNYEFQDFSFDYKKIKELKTLRDKKVKG